MRHRLLVRLVGLLMAASVSAVAQEEMRPRRYMPTDWVAFVADYGGLKGAEHYFPDLTPEVIVYRDGRIVWRQGSGERSTWLEGVADPRKLAALKSLADRNGFFSLRAEPPRPRRQSMGDVLVTDLGLSFSGRKRVVSTYGLEFFGPMPTAESLLRSTIEVGNAIRSLRPKVSRPHTPLTIRVGLYMARHTHAPVEWPLSDAPVEANSSWGPYSFYTGEDARRVMAALGQGAAVRVGGTVYQAEWAPAISIPEPTVAAGPFQGQFEQHPERPSSMNRRAPVRLLKPDRVLRGHADAVCTLAWSPDGKRLASASPSNGDFPRTWNARTGAPLNTLRVDSYIDLVRWSPDSKCLALGVGGAIGIWRSGDQFDGSLGSGGDRWTSGIAWSPDGTRVAVGPSLEVLDFRSGKPIWKGTGRQSTGGIDWSPDGRRLATSDARGKIHLWDGQTGRPLREIRSAPDRHHEYEIQHPLSWSPNGLLIALPGAADSTVRLFDPRTGKDRRSLRYLGPTANSLSWSRDSRRLAATSGDTLWIWDLRTGQREAIRGPSGLYSATWSPDGRWIGVGSADGTVLLWKTSKILRKTDKHRPTRK